MIYVYINHNLIMFHISCKLKGEKTIDANNEIIYSKSYEMLYNTQSVVGHATVWFR